MLTTMIKGIYIYLETLRGSPTEIVAVQVQESACNTLELFKCCYVVTMQKEWQNFSLEVPSEQLTSGSHLGSLQVA